MISIDDIHYHTCSPLEFTDLVFKKLRTLPEGKTIVVHINLRNFYYLSKDTNLREKIKNNCIAAFEGIGLKFGFWLKGFGFLPDLNGTDLLPLFMNRITGANLKVYLLGSENRIIEKAADNLSKMYPGVNICGTHHGYFNTEIKADIINAINLSKADILIIGMGFPLQERFVLENMNELKVSLIWNVGGLFDIVSGIKPRAPRFIRMIRLEWLFRFIMEPHRMLHRNTICAFGSFKHIFQAKNIYVQ
jgi:exopolysaccharide biosynthesis WecB/TagA/CpsF family protein